MTDRRLNVANTEAGGAAPTSSPRSIAQADLVTYRGRRDRELGSLYAIARSLAALRELDEVLDSIVRHAHELIGTDFTYLSLVGPDKDLSLKASAGTISAEFLAARIPSNTGLGGRVIDTGRAMWVSNYLRAGDLTHVGEFDALVAPEGLVALLGVPLLVRSEVVGVLFAADRTERPFETDEIALLSAFADHAAIALNNARLYDESRAAVQRLESAYATMERAQAVHEALSNAVLSGGGPGDVAQQLVEHVGGTVTVLERDDSILLSRPQGASPVRHDSSEVAAAIVEARNTGRCVTIEDSVGLSQSAAAIQAGNSYLGALLLTRQEQPPPIDVRTLERATHVMGMLILKESAVAQTAERLSGEMMTNLLVSSPVVGPAQRARAQARGLLVDKLNVVVVVDALGMSTGEVSRHLHNIATEWNGLSGVYLGRATMLLNVPDRDAITRLDTVTRAIHQRLRGELRQQVTVVSERVRGTDWARAFSIANRCCAVIQALGRPDQGASSDQYAVYALLFDTERAVELGRFIEDTIGPVLAYDARRSTDLVNTMTQYFAHNGNVAQSARALHVHLNTLLKRMERISVLLGEDWRSPEFSLPLQLTLRLHELRTAVELPQVSTPTPR
ncbi:helix-turn-helix domain-containing protein [Leekyejoonella antrihumi]|uniref:GAF domain-containing protein n=1 Tax=Leekyejoonella antrihumi TaxID=1660198 RepID=A0A563E653_9MICO|nr:GAF domain-containing protein [Leekyejoonella antrihumi]TWP38048.1 GAF domain-containing protein [Leekyejoonella antrihumi]